jgi:hypothetical protein
VLAVSPNSGSVDFPSRTNPCLRNCSAGAEVRRAGTGTVSVHVAASVTTTLGGLAADARCQVADGVWAAGADAGGIAAGGYASGLAAALVTGRIAAEGALAA